MIFLRFCCSISMHSINIFSGSVLSIMSSHASLYFVYVTNSLLGCAIMYSAGGFLLGKKTKWAPRECDLLKREQAGLLKR